MSFRGLAFSFRMGKSTVAMIVKETVTAVWEELQQIYMPTPSEKDFEKIANEFAEFWNFPHVIGCLDGKHVRIKCPDNSGSMYFNYKKHFSIILQGLVDANYKFITVDVGGYGKQSDGGTFLVSHLHEFIESGDITFPEPKMLPNTNIQAPFVILADEAYPLLPHLMTPYKRKTLNSRKRNFNNRLSRARKSVECAFGILYAKWRILSKELETNVDLTETIVKCICILHNTIIEREGIERHMTEVEVQEIGESVVWQREGRQQNTAKQIRDTMAIFMEKYPLSYKSYKIN